MKTVILQGSSRSFGNTNKIVQLIRKSWKADLIDLNQKNITAFDYKHRNRTDDFLPLIRKIVRDYDLILFATPVYWYAMSGIMKTFFDRITDLLTLEKETGRKLRGKSMGIICCGSEAVETEGFFIPFEQSATYLGMNYVGHVHTWIEADSLSVAAKLQVEDFIKKLEAFKIEKECQ